MLKFDPQDVKALLLLGNAPAYPSEEKLVITDGKIRAMFLPPNTTSVIQPMDQGVISAYKHRYQQRNLDEVLVVIEEDDDIENDTRDQCTLQKMKNYTIKSAIFNIANSWKDFKISTLANSWKNLLVDATDFHRVLLLAGEEEVTVDDVAEWLDNNESDPGYQIVSDEEIAAQVAAGDQESSEDDEEEMHVDKPKLSLVRGSADILICNLDTTSNKAAQPYYEGFWAFREIIIGTV